jgi:hypothetical protein
MSQTDSRSLVRAVPAGPSPTWPATSARCTCTRPWPCARASPPSFAPGQPASPVPAGLALDGVDELLKVFVAGSVTKRGEYFTNILGGSPDRTYSVRADGAAWRLRTGPGLSAGQDGAGDDPADVTVSGPPAASRHWVRNREGTG